MENDTNFSNAKGKEMLKSETDKRATEDAGIKLNKILEERGEEIAVNANLHAKDDHRKTVRAVDIRKAIRDLERDGGKVSDE